MVCRVHDRSTERGCGAQRTLKIRPYLLLVTIRPSIQNLDLHKFNLLHLSSQLQKSQWHINYKSLMDFFTFGSNMRIGKTLFSYNILRIYYTLRSPINELSIVQYSNSIFRLLYTRRSNLLFGFWLISFIIY